MENVAGVGELTRARISEKHLLPDIFIWGMSHSYYRSFNYPKFEVTNAKCNTTASKSTPKVLQSSRISFNEFSTSNILDV